MTCPVTFASYRQQANDGLRFLISCECFATVLGHDTFREIARDIIKIFQKWKLMRVFLSIVIIISIYSSHTTGYRPPLILCESFVVPTRAHYRLGTSHTAWNWSAGFPYSSSCSINRLRLNEEHYVGYVYETVWVSLNTQSPIFNAMKVHRLKRWKYFRIIKYTSSHMLHQ